MARWAARVYAAELRTPFVKSNSRVQFTNTKEKQYDNSSRSFSKFTEQHCSTNAKPEPN
jgi:hypothetical protein